MGCNGHILVLDTENMPEFVKDCVFDIYNQNNVNYDHIPECYTCICCCGSFSTSTCMCCSCREMTVWHRLKDYEKEYEEGVRVIYYECGSNNNDNEKLQSNNIDDEVVSRLNKAFSEYVNEYLYETPELFDCQTIYEFSELYEKYFIMADIQLWT